jgi:hypothetical protein
MPPQDNNGCLAGILVGLLLDVLIVKPKRASLRKPTLPLPTRASPVVISQQQRFLANRDTARTC